MARYFFDVHDGLEHRDEIGREIDDRTALRTEALRVISVRFATTNEDSDGYTIVLNVRDEQGANVLTLRMVCQVDDPAMQNSELGS